MTGATEATLSELLAVAKSMDRNIASLNRLYAASGGGGGGSGGGISGPVGALSSALSIAAAGVKAAFGLLTDLIGTLAAGIGKLIGGVAAAATGMINFAAAAARGQATLSTFYESFSKMPFFIGEVSGVFATMIKVAEGLLGNFRQMADAGAGFGGDLIGMRLAAGRAGIDINTFTKIVRENSDIFASANKTVQSGVNFFVGVQQQLMGPGSRFHKTFTQLGYTAEQAAEMTTTYIRLQGGMFKTEMQNTNTVAEGVARMAQEIDLYAKVTGQSREAVEKQMRERSQDEAFQARVAAMGATEKARTEMALTEAMRMGGKGLQDMLKSLILSNGEIAIVTDDAKKAQVASGNSAEQVARRLLSASQNIGLAGVDLQTEFKEAATQLADGTRQFLATTPGVINQTSRFMQGQNQLFANAQQQAGKTFAQNRKTAEDAAKQQSDQAGKLAQNMANAEKTIRDFGNAIFSVVAYILTPLLPPLTKFATSMIAASENMAKKAAPYIEKFIKVWQESIWPRITAIGSWFGDQADKLLQSKNTGEFWTQLGNSIREGFTNIWKTFEPVWNKEVKPVLVKLWEDLINFMKPYFTKMMDSIFDSINAWVYNATKTTFGENPALRARGRELQTQAETQINIIKDYIARIEKAKSEGNTDLVNQLKRAMFPSIGGPGLTTPAYRSLTDSSGLENPAVVGPLIRDWARSRKEELDKMLLPYRQLGTLGATGKTSEPSDTLAQIHQGERVLNPSETSVYNNLGTSINQLNSLTAQLLAAMRENNDLTRKTLSATKSIGGNLFA